MQDPDGFVVEVTQLTPLPAAAARRREISSARASRSPLRIQTQTVKFYRDVLGFQLRVGESFTGNKLMADTAGTPGAQFRQSSGQIPGTTVRMTFIEFKGIDRESLIHARAGPRHGHLQLQVRDVEAAVKKLKAGGGTVISTGGEPVTLGTRKLAIVRDPNNLFLELLSAP